MPFVDARWRTLADRESRAITGKSSGGFGAMITPMLRPDVFGALATHAGDTLYESELRDGLRRGRPRRCATRTAARSRSSGRLPLSAAVHEAERPRPVSTTAWPRPLRRRGRHRTAAVRRSPGGWSSRSGNAGWTVTPYGWRPSRRTPRRCGRSAASGRRRQARRVLPRPRRAGVRRAVAAIGVTGRCFFELFDGAHGGSSTATRWRCGSWPSGSCTEVREPAGDRPGGQLPRGMPAGGVRTPRRRGRRSRRGRPTHAGCGRRCRRWPARGRRAGRCGRARARHRPPAGRRR